ncbi:MAG: hypothetical protein L0H39_08485, partial [Brachybacterium sp.]|nr:hypothetical protein [Brachybacterium sp.]
MSIARRTRTAVALVAGAALLGLGACATGDGDGAEGPSAAPSTSSDDGEVQGTEQDADAEDEGDEGADGDGTSAAGERTRIMLRIDLGLDDTSGEGALAHDDLAALLAEPFGGTAECDADLVLEPGAAPVDCVGPASFGSAEPTQEWVAHPVLVPSDSGFQDGTRVAVLFS